MNLFLHEFHRTSQTLSGLVVAIRWSQFPAQSCFRWPSHSTRQPSNMADMMLECVELLTGWHAMMRCKENRCLLMAPRLKHLKHPCNEWPQRILKIKSAHLVLAFFWHSNDETCPSMEKKQQAHGWATRQGSTQRSKQRNMKKLMLSPQRSAKVSNSFCDCRSRWSSNPHDPGWSLCLVASWDIAGFNSSWTKTMQEDTMRMERQIFVNTSQMSQHVWDARASTHTKKTYMYTHTPKYTFSLDHPSNIINIIETLRPNTCLGSLEMF